MKLLFFNYLKQYVMYPKSNPEAKAERTPYIWLSSVLRLGSTVVSSAGVSTSVNSGWKFGSKMTKVKATITIPIINYLPFNFVERFLEH